MNFGVDVCQVDWIGQKNQIDAGKLLVGSAFFYG